MIDILILQCYNVGTTKRKEMIIMENANSFSLDTLDDEFLNILYADVCREVNARAEAKAAKEVKRAQWVRQMCDNYLRHPNSTYMQIGEITVVSVYSRYDGLCIGRARPVNGDEYNPEVGIAVAFAKVCGESVPTISNRYPLPFGEREFLFRHMTSKFLKNSC